jgi:hypothetical protein
MTVYFPTSTFEIFRKRRIGVSNRYSMSATLTAYVADIQPEGNPERVGMDASRYGTVWTAFVDTSVDIREGDEIHIIDTDKVYSVKGVIEYASAGLLDHKELTLVSQDGQI